MLHPHPLGGGTMHNKVVFHAARALNDSGVATLRINFRGVGQSTGTHDEGRGEVDDVRAGLDHLAQKFSDQHITVCGFSFGARVGLEVGIADARVSNLISIGTPLEKYDFEFIAQCRKPILFVHGELDEFGKASDLRKLVAQLPPELTTLVVIKDAGHFFEDRLEEMKAAIKNWVTDQLGASHRDAGSGL
ncbi:MAG TPA: alpha/beta fold hydrolase [Pyrinomonadaceae bacterium]|nr:alpha/beta fold hydrolase [Pyrinomonadaceae bacterium]